MDIKKILESLDQLSEATKETPTGKIHKAEPGGYGRKFDTDEEGDEDKKDKKKKAEPAEKRGRGRPPKEGGESDKKSKEIGQSTKALQSFMVGNLPKGKLPGKATTKHTLKDWIEIVKENQNVSVEPLKQQSSVVKKNGEVVAQVDDPNLARQIQQGLSSGKMSISGEQGMDEAASYKPSGRVRTQEIYDKEGNRLGGIIIDYDLDPDHWEAFTITKTGQLGKRQKFKDTGEAIRWVRSNSFMSSQSPVKEEGVMEGSEEKPPRMTHTCEKCGKKWQLQHHCKGAPNKKQGVAEGKKKFTYKVDVPEGTGNYLGGNVLKFVANNDDEAKEIARKNKGRNLKRVIGYDNSIKVPMTSKEEPLSPWAFGVGGVPANTGPFNKKKQGVAEGSDDKKRGVSKKIILKNLIKLAKEQGNQQRVQKLELELKKLDQQGVAEGLPGSSQIYDQIESLSDKLKHTSDPDERRFYVKQIKKLEHKLHSTDDPFDIDDPAPIGKKGVAEGDEPERIEYEQMKDKISSVLIKLYDQGNNAETIKQMGDRVANYLGYDPNDSNYRYAWMSSFTDASLDGSLDQDHDDYTDYTMRQGERGNPDRFREQGVAEGYEKKDVLNKAVNLYRELSKKYPHKIAVQKAAESHNLDSVKLNSYIDHGRYSSKQGVAEGSYREGGSITHDGVEYDFDSVMSIAEKLPTKTCSVDKLSWVLKYDTPDEHRVKKADISVPLIVTKSVDGKLAAIDGLHRLTKAVRNGVKTLPVKYIEPSELESAKLKQKGVTEGMDPEKRTRLDDLIDQFSDATDPSDYGNDNDPEDVIAMIRAEFGDKIADQVASGAEKMHFGHHPHQRSDPLAWKTYRGKNRVTKGGKLFKQDSDYLKNTIKSRYKLSGKSATEGVAEADMPTDQGDVGAGLGAGRSQTTLEDTNSSIFKGTQLAEASRK